MKFFNFFNKAKTRDDNVNEVRSSWGLSGGTVVNPDTAMQSSAFYRGVIYVSTQIAKLPWKVKDKTNKSIENELSYILNVAPNPEMTAFHFKLFLIQCAIIQGNGFAEIERSLNGSVKHLWPLNPNRVRPVRTPEGTLLYEVVNGTGANDVVYLLPKDIYIVRNFHTKDALQGQGVVAYAMEVLGITLGADKFANSLYSNGGLPSGVLKIPGRLSDEAFKRVKETWRESHGGRKAGGTAILEDGLEYSPISHSPDVMQFLESRKFNVVEMARFLGVPPTKLFDTGAATFNNVENANLEVATDTLDAWARNLEGEADMKLLPRNGSFTELDLYAVFRGDMVTRSTYFKNMMSVGSMNPNEIREKEGEAPYEGGDRFYIATNNFTPSDRMDEVIDSQIKSKQLPAPATPPKEEEESEDPVDLAVISYLQSKTRDR